MRTEVCVRFLADNVVMIHVAGTVICQTVVM